MHTSREKASQTFFLSKRWLISNPGFWMHRGHIQNLVTGFGPFPCTRVGVFSRASFCTSRTHFWGHPSQSPLFHLKWAAQFFSRRYNNQRFLPLNTNSNHFIFTFPYYRICLIGPYSINYSNRPLFLYIAQSTYEQEIHVIQRLTPEIIVFLNPGKPTGQK